MTQGRSAMMSGSLRAVTLLAMLLATSPVMDAPIAAASVPGPAAPVGRGGQERWARVFGTSSPDVANAVTVDAAGDAYVAGDTWGAFLGKTNAGANDAFVRKYGSDGNLTWTRQFGTPAYDIAWAVAVDVAGDAYVAGYTGGTLAGQVSAGDSDAFVRKYGPGGRLLWARQFGTRADDIAWAVAVDGTGDAYVSGSTWGVFPGRTSYGANDAFLRKYGADGSVRWTRQFGSAKRDSAGAVAVDGDGDAYIAGTTEGLLPGQTALGRITAFVREYGPNGGVRWTRQFGSTPEQYTIAYAIALDDSGDAYVAGQASSGGSEAFLREYGPSGGLLQSRHFGARDDTGALGVAVDTRGVAYVAGYTYGAFPGHANAGLGDAFVRAIGPGGGIVWTRQFGSSGYDSAQAVSIDALGDVYVAGYIALSRAAKAKPARGVPSSRTAAATPRPTPKPTPAPPEREAFLRKYGPASSP